MIILRLISNEIMSTKQLNRLQIHILPVNKIKIIIQNRSDYDIKTLFTDKLLDEIFYKLNKLSIEVPFIVLLPIDAKSKPEYHIFNKYVLHFEVIMENLNFGVYSPPKDDSNT